MAKRGRGNFESFGLGGDGVRATPRPPGVMPAKAPDAPGADRFVHDLSKHMDGEGELPNPSDEKYDDDFPAERNPTTGLSDVGSTQATAKPKTSRKRKK